jgi:hypothetical protein
VILGWYTHIGYYGEKIVNLKSFIFKKLLSYLVSTHWVLWEKEFNIKSCIFKKFLWYSVSTQWLSREGQEFPTPPTLWGVLKVSYPAKAEGYFVVQLPNSKGVCCYPTLTIASKYWKFSRATRFTLPIIATKLSLG